MYELHISSHSSSAVSKLIWIHSGHEKQCGSSSSSNKVSWSPSTLLSKESIEIFFLKFSVQCCCTFSVEYSKNFHEPLFDISLFEELSWSLRLLDFRLKGH